MKKDLERDFKEVKLIFMDVDGVLNDGVICSFGGRSVKSWYVRDRLALKALTSFPGLDIKVIWITGRTSEDLQETADELGIAEVYDNIRNKLKVMKEVSDRLGVAKENTLYIGDDIVDLACLEFAGIACCPSDAVSEVRSVSHFISSFPGGFGAVREILEKVLKSIGVWEDIIESFKKDI